MCGICGVVDYSKQTTLEIADNMIELLKHRGPDAQKSLKYESDNADILLSHARLSIIDTSELANQPMVYKNLTIVFNGEIYNHQEIKKELIGLKHSFKTNSDTEVILHAFHEWGENSVAKLNGMFAFAIYNTSNQKLWLVRDRLGVKPLYFYYKENQMMFSSELKAFHQHPYFDKKINFSAVYDYFEKGYINGKHSVFQFVNRIEAATINSIDLKTKEIITKKYWDINSFFLKPKLKYEYTKAKQELKELLRSSYNYRMIADVPVGVFLSGGYDSTSVAAILQETSKNPIKTFTIGFHEGNNEAEYAKDTARLLNTDHKEYYCTEKEAKSIVKEIPFFYDEPYADSSQIPTILVSKMAKENVKVVLSADGGDEQFIGYNIYHRMNKRIGMLSKLPLPLKYVSKIFFSIGYHVLPPGNYLKKEKFKILSETILLSENEMAHYSFNSARNTSQSILNKILKIEPSTNTISQFYNNFKNINDVFSSMDIDGYLKEDILTKVDRATMSQSIEGREPMLDYRLMEFSAQLPNEFKYKNGVGKRILKDIVHDYVPKEMMERPKTGFAIPIIKWLKEDLSYLVDDFLSQEALKKSKVFNESEVLKLVKVFKEKDSVVDGLIWKILVYQMWYNEWIEKLIKT